MIAQIGMKIILERNLDFNQFKNVFILNFVCASVLLMLYVAEPIALFGGLKLLIGVLVLLLISLMFLKKGLVVDDRNLFIGYFLFGLSVFKRMANRDHMKIVAVLTFKNGPNYNYTRWPNFAKWEPNLEYTTSSFQVFFLNENHTEKEHIVSLLKKENSERAIEFLLKNMNVRLEVYIPSF